MIIVADSGSTKTDWVLIDKDKRFRYKTTGYNPYFVDSENIYRSLSQKLVPHFNPEMIDKVYFYGAGCSTDENVETVNKALTRFFSKSEIAVGHDLLAAARALLGDERGFAAILGTGSNTCIYNGKDVELNIDSLGYLLGDEGSGSYIGKKLLRDYMRDLLPWDLKTKFDAKYNLTNEQIFDCVYHKEVPNRYLASFCLFADDNKEHPHIKNIVREAFSDFFTSLVSKYPEYQKYSFNCIGSVGSIFSNILREVCASHNMPVGKIVNSPIDDLVAYHLK